MRRLHRRSTQGGQRLSQSNRQTAEQPTIAARYEPAKFWGIDLHVHTAASKDVSDRYGDTSPDALVAAALTNGLAAIAITDHNTADGCAAVSAAADGTELTVLPGVEISTQDGHLLAIFEVGTQQSVIDDMLTEVGIKTADRGKLDRQAKFGFRETAEIVVEAGGLAIPAHIDKAKGLLGMGNPMTVKSLLSCPAFAAFELVDLEQRTSCQNRADTDRTLAFVQSSDSMGDNSWHEATAVGRRRTYIKASRPDLRGITHALADPALRVRNSSVGPAAHQTIEAVRVTGGFFDTEHFSLSEDLNCLVAGTGAGKSLFLEIIRFALDQQADATEFQAVREEVDSRLEFALRENSVVEIDVRVDGNLSTVQRSYDPAGSSSPVVVAGALQQPVESAFPIRAFSQGEVLDYARREFGRMTFVDSGLDISQPEHELSKVAEELSTNDDQLLASLGDRGAAAEELKEKQAIDETHTTLADLFDEDIVKTEELWSSEANELVSMRTLVGQIPAVPVEVPDDLTHASELKGTEVVFNAMNTAISEYRDLAAGTLNALRTAHKKMTAEINAAVAEWDALKLDRDREVNLRIAGLGTAPTSLESLRQRLEEVTKQRLRLNGIELKLREELEPRVAGLSAERELLTGRLIESRRLLRALRQKRCAELNTAMGGAVRLKITNQGDSRMFAAEMDTLLDRSGIHNTQRTLLIEKCDPVRLVRSFLDDSSEAVADIAGVPEATVRRWFEHVRENQLERKMLSLQAVPLEDTLSVEFRLPGSTEYRPIERIAHGQKCTAILILAMASGSEPLLVDQPEDALHAPWIEEHLVPRLRELRGSRQFIFATRSPGIVVSADAEMIITLESKSESGRLEACGSLERHELNELTLLHVEGGALPFKRRSVKLNPSLGKLE